jgi:heme-degrading monooxygenase HmoA
MYARKVSLCLKSESTSQFIRKVEHEVVPLFRKQKGFFDHLILLSDKGKVFYLYTFWENGEDAEKYDRTTLPALNQLLTTVVDGALRVHAFAGSRGSLSSGSR